MRKFFNTTWLQNLKKNKDYIEICDINDDYRPYVKYMIFSHEGETFACNLHALENAFSGSQHPCAMVEKKAKTVVYWDTAGDRLGP